MNAELDAAHLLRAARRHGAGGASASGAHHRAARGTADGGTGGGEKINDAAIRYINRLSDHLFVASRYVNDKGAKDVLWVPGATVSGADNR